MSDSPCVKNGTEHVWEYVGSDGITYGSNACQVEGCGWFRAVERPKRRRAPKAKRPSPSGTGLEDLLSFRKPE